MEIYQQKRRTLWKATQSGNYNKRKTRKMTPANRQMDEITASASSNQGFDLFAFPMSATSEEIFSFKQSWQESTGRDIAVILNDVKFVKTFNYGKEFS